MTSTSILYDYLIGQAKEIGHAAVYEACKRYLREGSKAEITKTKRKVASKAERNRIYVRQNGRCAEPKCQHPITVREMCVDEYEPISRGGLNKPSNRRGLCKDCNQRKHAKEPLRWSKEQGITIAEELMTTGGE